MTLLQKINLSTKYAKGVYITLAIYSLAAAVLCFVYPTTAPICIILKLLSIPVVLYLFKSFQNKHTIYFYINLGISRIEYYIIPIVVEFMFFAVLLSISISIGNAIG
jgi:hypothetical protein